MDTKRLVVLSSKEQFETFVKSALPLSGCTVLSDNPRLYEFLKTQHVSFGSIDEFLIELHWQKINEWAIGSMSDWGRLAKDEKLFSEIDWCSVVRHSFSYILIQIVKNRKMAEAILNRYVGSAICIFEDATRKEYPFFWGNAYLNDFLSELAAEQQRTVHVLKIATTHVLEGDFPIQLPWFKKTFRRLKCIAEILPSLTWTCFGQADFVIFGSLKHLGDVMKELKKRGSKVAIYDFEYHGEQFGFAVKNGFRYWLPRYFLKGSGRKDQSFWAVSQYAEFKAAFHRAREAGFFHFEGYDYGPILSTVVLSTMQGFFEKASHERAIYRAILDSKHCKAWIVDDDYATKGGFLAAFLKARKVDAYCISHANMLVNFSVSPAQRRFTQSTTLVHSEHEKRMYENRGWDPARISVTGSPRYDRIVRLMQGQQSRERKEGELFKLFLPATHLWPSSPDIRGYLGSHITGTGDFQGPSYQKLIQAIGGLPVELIVKPHDLESSISWANYIRRVGSSAKVTLVSHNSDFLKLLLACDAMVSCCWSTTLIEAGLARKPAFFVVGKPIANAELDRFVKAGFCQMLENVESLRAALTVLCASGAKKYYASISTIDEDYYLGYRDGRSKQRVVDLILSRINPVNAKGVK